MRWNKEQVRVLSCLPQLWAMREITACHDGRISNRSVSLYLRSSSVLIASCWRSTSICRSCSSRLRSMPGRFSICSRICWNFFCSSFTLRLTSVGPRSRLQQTDNPQQNVSTTIHLIYKDSAAVLTQATISERLTRLSRLLSGNQSLDIGQPLKEQHLPIPLIDVTADL